ncbi:MAG: GNAT family N-acetyltransferase [Patescibacteria group bacterium]|nr:GNAT family N-acetyltransferase [Patescibacteria group bacterium]
MENDIIIRIMTMVDAVSMETNGLMKTLGNLTKSPLIDTNAATIAFYAISLLEGSIVFVAEEDTDEDKQLVGFIKLVIDTKFSHDVCRAGRIEDVVVRKGYESKGIATKLMEKAVEKAKEIGCYKITLDCRLELESFYNKFGFSQHEISMRLDL